ncbi:helix-turn-helix domain-containing protein, partial [bacterium LRH843]|nr:helix-turn-helix domain-containing protein [bacterium LRH843]
MSDKGVAAVERALAILDCFESDQESLPLKTIAQKTGLYKSTILRLCVSLESYGYLRRREDG